MDNTRAGDSVSIEWILLYLRIYDKHSHCDCFSYLNVNLRERDWKAQAARLLCQRKTYEGTFDSLCIIYSLILPWQNSQDDRLFSLQSPYQWWFRFSSRLASNAMQNTRCVNSFHCTIDACEHSHSRPSNLRQCQIQQTSEWLLVKLSIGLLERFTKVR